MALFPSSVPQSAYALVRFGYGWPAHGAPTTAAAMLDQLRGPDLAMRDYPKLTFPEAVALTAEYLAVQKEARNAMADAGDRQKLAAKAMRTAGYAGLAADLARIAQTADPFRERLVHFWGNHFAVRVQGRRMQAVGPVYSDDAIRPSITGRFADLLKAAILHPIMLNYLDQTASFGPNSEIGKRRGRGLNENLAREVLELHTLGVGAAYGQADVTEFAELLTGLAVNYSQSTKAIFNPRRAEPGAETVLGTRYGGGAAEMADIHAVLDDLAVHPATAAHISGKLAKHFVADTPPQSLVDAMARAWAETAGDLMAVYTTMLNHPAAWTAFGAKVKMPFDYVASGLRALGLTGDTLASIKQGRLAGLVTQPLVRMGQAYLRPAGPDGFADEADAWVQPYGIALRISWAMNAAQRFGGRRRDPLDFAQETLGPLFSDRLRTAVGAAETRAEAMGLVLASAEFNRR